MATAVVGKAPRIVKFVGIFVAGLMETGIPHPGWMPRLARDGAVETRIPDPSDLIPLFDGDGGGRKIVPARPDADGKGLSER